LYLQLLKINAKQSEAIAIKTVEWIFP
jgi:hypothetical protein